MVSANKTPAMLQYLAAKEAHPDALLFFRMGDFYELFFEDAVEASRILELTLTSRNKKSDNPVPMAGVPYHAARNYVQRLVETGRKVAICEQIEDPKHAKGVVKRAVTHVVTPGVNLDEAALQANLPNYLMAVHENLDGFFLAYADVTTGEFRATSLPTVQALRSELLRIQPREVLLSEEMNQRHPQLALDGIVISTLPEASFIPKDSSGNAALGGVESACAGLVTYLAKMHPAAQKVLQTVESYSLDTTLQLEESTLVNLEVLQTLMTGQRKGSLLGLMDKTVTAMGARKLRSWLQAPLVSLPAIQSRQDAVEALVEDTITRGELREALHKVYDLERLAGRLLAGLASPKDLGSLRRSLRSLPEVLTLLKASPAKRLRALQKSTDPLQDILQDVETHLAEELPMALKDGGVVRAGVDPDLDELRELSTNGKNWLLKYEAEERRDTGITSLKVRYNRVFGYYIEISKANVHLAPAHYVRKQTLVNAERYFTETLKEYEDKILSAEEKMLALESQIFESLRGRVADEARRIAHTARQIAELDVYAGLAVLAQERRYCRPQVNRSKSLRLRGARHAVIEGLMEDGAFVPNDLDMNPDTGNFLLITGPNMAGKSTVMRQVALIALMAQVGSFVPADEAEIGLVDRIFTRVGASDNLSRGQSTFMVEMTETATILNHATDRSLVILDEIGRGTSTYDGLSIAWAVVEHIHDKLLCRTLFATHYHELTSLSEALPRVTNHHIAVREFNDDIIFLHKLMPGGTNRSYGIQVGRLAGLPREVIDRSKEILKSLEDMRSPQDSPKALVSAEPVPGLSSLQLSFFGGAPLPSKVEEALRGVQPDVLSPLEALQELYRLKGILSEED